MIFLLKFEIYIKFYDIIFNQELLPVDEKLCVYRKYLNLRFGTGYWALKNDTTLLIYLTMIFQIRQYNPQSGVYIAVRDWVKYKQKSKVKQWVLIEIKYILMMSSSATFLANPLRILA